MSEPRLARLYVAVGALGGEVVLMLSLPFLARRYGNTEVALLGLAVVAGNAGKLLGCLKVDAAITNAEPERVGAVHALAVVALVATGLGVAAAAAALAALGLLPALGVALAVPLGVAFVGGGLQQAASMRLLRDGHLRWFAFVKALPSLALVVIAFGLGPGLLRSYELAFLVLALVVALLHARPPAGGLAGLKSAVQRELGAARSFILHGAPASALDAGNLFLLSLLTIAIAGTNLAGEATQLQRYALGPSLAASMLLSQHAWRQRFDADSVSLIRASYSLTARIALAAGLVSAVGTLVLLFTPLGHRLAPVRAGDALAVIACLAPLLAQYVGSPLTVYFFKRERVQMYAMLQFVLLGLLGATAVWFELSGTAGRPEFLLPLAVASLVATFTLTATAVRSTRAP